MEHIAAALFRFADQYSSWFKKFDLRFFLRRKLSQKEIVEKLEFDFSRAFLKQRKGLRALIARLDKVEALAFCAASGMIPRNQEQLSTTEYIATNVLSSPDKGRKVSAADFYRLYKVANRLKFLEVQSNFSQQDSAGFSVYLENMFIRGTGRTPLQSFETAIRRFAPHNKWLQQNVGFSIEDAILFANSIIDLIEKRLTQLGIDGDQIERQTLRFDHWGLFLIPQRTLAMLVKNILWFTPSDLETPKGKEDQLNAFLDRFSGIIGRYIEQESYGDDISLFNKPIVSINKQEYFVPFPSLIVEALPEALYEDLKADAVYWSKNAMTKGRAAEERLIDMLGTVFLKDFIFPNPLKKKGEELIDALVSFDKKLIIGESKSRYLPREAKKNPVVVQAYLQETVREGLSQAETAQKFLTTKPQHQFPNARGNTRNIDSSNVKHWFTILVLDERLSPMAISDFLRSNTGAYSELPFIIDINDLEYITSHFDTPQEFIKYLEYRQDFLKSGKYQVASELDLLGYYKLHGRTFPRVEDEERLTWVVFDGLWEAYLEKYRELILEKLEADHISYFVDSVLERAHTAGQGSLEIAEELSKLTRMDRRALSRKAFSKAMLSAEDKKPHYAYHQFDSIDFGVVYLFSPEARKARSERLQVLCALARYKTKTKKVIGIASEPADQKETILTFCMYDGEIPLDPEMEEEASKFFGPATYGSENEYPRLTKEESGSPPFSS